MTPQEIFNKAYHGVVNQGEPSMREDLNGPVCLYRGPNGLKCAAGHLVDDEWYNPLFENLTADLVAHNVNAPDWFKRNWELIRRLQRAHDRHCTLSGKEFVKAFKRQCAVIAETHGLGVPKDG